MAPFFYLQIAVHMEKEIMLLAAIYADCGEIDPRLRSWVKARMEEYLHSIGIHCDGLWDKKSMAEWVGYDLDIDEVKAYHLCDVTGFPEGSVA